MPKAKRTTKADLKKKRKTYTKFISVFKDEIQLHAFKCNKEIAKSYANEAKEVIKKQLYRWAPLSPKYLEDKIQKGYDSRIYIRTGEFLASIMWGVTHGKVWTGIPARVMHTGKFARADEPDRKPIPMRVLARWLEYGTTLIPPRPVWRPLLAKYVRLRPDFGRRYRKAADAAIKRKTKVGRK